VTNNASAIWGLVSPSAAIRAARDPLTASASTPR
jgi:hypothetical protein